MSHISIPVTTLIQHFLFLFLLVVVPAWDFYDTRRLKRSRAICKTNADFRCVAIGACGGEQDPSPACAIGSETLCRGLRNFSR